MFPEVETWRWTEVSSVIIMIIVKDAVFLPTAYTRERHTVSADIRYPVDRLEAFGQMLEGRGFKLSMHDTMDGSPRQVMVYDRKS